MASKDVTTRHIDATETTFAILETLMASNGARVTEVANRLDIAPSTAHSHLATLEGLRYVVREDDYYHIGLRFLELGNHARQRERAYAEMDLTVEKLARETEERAQFAVEENGMCVFLNRAEGEHGINTSTSVGSQIYLNQVAVGKAILAHLPERRVDEIVDRRGLPAATDATITDRETLDSELATIRDRGYAINDEEFLDGVRAIATTVEGPSGGIVGALGLAGPANRMTGDWFETELPSQILGVANEIELNLKFSS